MKKVSLLALSLFFIATFFFGCKKKDSTNPLYPYQAEVLGRNSDCGIYEIKITKGLQDVKKIVGTSVGNSIYIAENLPHSLQKSGLKIVLDIRKPKSNELGLCTAVGPSYTWLYVVRAKKADQAEK